VGIFIPLAVAALSLWRGRDLKELRALRLAWSVPAVLLASSPWYAYIFLFVDKAAMAEMSTGETMGRVLGTFGDRGFDPPYLYFLVALPGLLPWTFLLPWAIWARRRMAPDRLRLFFEVWFAAVFIFFSLCAIKKPQYIVMLSCVFAGWLGMVAAAALAAAPGKCDKGLVASLFVFLALCIVGGFKGLSYVSKHQPELLAGFIATAVTVILPALTALWLAARGHGRSALVALSCTMFLSLAPALGFGAPWAEKYRSIKPFLEENRELISRAGQIYAGVKIFNGLPFYLQRRVLMDTDEQVLIEKLRGTEPCIVFTSDKRYRKNENLFAPYLTEKKYGKVLLSNFAAKRELP
jgi:4-amino-4-deoxy-L-arabinose transferase-like glycosyltransferase